MISDEIVRQVLDSYNDLSAVGSHKYAMKHALGVYDELKSDDQVISQALDRQPQNRKRLSSYINCGGYTPLPIDPSIVIKPPGKE